MFTKEDHELIQKSINSGEWFEVLILCMMRNGATLDEVVQARDFKMDTAPSKLDDVVKFSVKYLNLKALGLEEVERYE